MATGGYSAENDFEFLADFYFTIFIYSLFVVQRDVQKSNRK